jgi:hypothetical protein
MDVLFLRALASAGTCLPGRYLAMGLWVTIWRQRKRQKNNIEIYRKLIIYEDWKWMGLAKWSCLTTDFGISDMNATQSEPSFSVFLYFI